MLGTAGTLTAGGLIGSAYKYSVEQFNDDEHGLKKWAHELGIKGQGERGVDGGGLITPPSLVKGDQGTKGLGSGNSGRGTLSPSAEEESNRFNGQLQGTVESALSSGTQTRTFGN
ncbi:hypothetical protein [Mycoplasma suis]|uniref:hypothetical protein n=1 Tax=Mycoplasma suis TaxID=57372 RepID=UPI0002F4C728|nr:hypothetical protein [Mycoplasma suis]